MSPQHTPVRCAYPECGGGCAECQPPAQRTPGPWVRYNPSTDTYDTPDGTKVGAELCDNAECLADILHIATVREGQRRAIATGAP